MHAQLGSKYRYSSFLGAFIPHFQTILSIDVSSIWVMRPIFRQFILDMKYLTYAPAKGDVSSNVFNDALFSTRRVSIYIDDVRCDVVPGSMRTHRNNINCSFARQFVHASRWSGHVLLKLPPRYTGHGVSHRVVQ